MSLEMTPSGSLDYLESYRKIQEKLKKKNILRKPNYGEAIDHLNQLIAALKRENPHHHYAAFCCLALARCEQALRNYTMEATACTDAGYICWDNEVESSEFGLLGFEEDATEAMDCYLLAIKIYLGNKRTALAASLYYEMAGILKRLNKLGEAAEYFQLAADLQQNDSALHAMSALQEAVDCLVLLRDYKSSCAALIWIIKLASEVNNLQELPGAPDSLNTSVSAKVLIESRISLCLLLILQGDFEQSKDFVRKLVEDATGCGLQVDSVTEVVCLLSTLVIVCEARDASAVKDIHRQLWTYLTPSQNETLLLIIEEINYHRRLIQT
eukprot:TRINITY_DN7166_c0_g1_i1.p1 TRINITY_DN7166_c0_g1~~TRINITY_DN7166_c0_g1_i1.p1  ORF type:complete len:326 (+),score=61.55 TRINITY_DN7166_c0_g1_i1:135-1112(+)